MDETLQWYRDENERLMCAIERAKDNNDEVEFALLCRQHRQLMRGYWRYVYQDVPLEEIEAEHQEMVRQRRELRERLKK